MKPEEECAHLTIENAELKRKLKEVQQECVNLRYDALVNHGEHKENFILWSRNHKELEARVNQIESEIIKLKSFHP